LISPFRRFEIKPISGPTGAYTMTIYGTGTVTIKEYGFLTKPNSTPSSPTGAARCAAG
jgi:hypothetical protein